MHSKFNVCRCLLLAVILGCCLVNESQAYCSLDEMKTFAMEACERLFLQDEGRERRSIDYSGHHENKLAHDKMHKDQHYIGRSNYPRGGYLKVSREHYHRLMRLDVMPRYKPRKQHQDKKMRFRRDSSSKSYNNISYCCYHHCNEEFFC
ncbi:uncharacterized protein LOC6558306 [Drosophila grimshawi]|uniref:GH15950 n=1 Tax=Drosophila grimshawi TaxID=7222 RepID=B4J1J5_DROGR|nr:uncharacterized protein LOC6558306 [Drosophila grimshawi]EDV95886.1 GH15950 [Drosophila grimshawi]